MNDCLDCGEHKKRKMRANQTCLCVKSCETFERKLHSSNPLRELGYVELRSPNIRTTLKQKKSLNKFIRDFPKPKRDSNRDDLQLY